MQERRIIPRKYLMFYARVFNRSDGSLMGYLSDITPSGAMLIGERPFQTQVSFRLRVDLPDGFGFSENHLDLEGVSVWSKRDIDPHFFNTGFSFTNVTPKEAETIKRIVKSYALSEE